MKWLQNERGSALLLVLLMTIIFAIIGLSLISSSLNGAQRNAFREGDTSPYIKRRKESNTLKNTGRNLMLH